MKKITNQREIILKRVSSAATAYNVSVRTILDFLSQKEFYNLSGSSQLTEIMLNYIKDEFSNDKLMRDEVNGKTKLIIKRKKYINQQVKRGEGLLVLNIKDDFFAKFKQHISYKKLPVIKSAFTNDEAIHLCSKMSSSFARGLCEKIVSNSNDEILYQIHSIANKALNIFGSKILSFIYTLKPLKFKNKTAEEVGIYDFVVPDFPLISIKINSSIYKLSFFVKKNDMTKHLSDIRLFAPKTYEEIGAIDNDGYLLSKLEKFNPQIQLFIDAISNGTFEIYSGVETGRCEVCGRELTLPLSLRIGIGPACASNRGIDKKSYSF